MYNNILLLAAMDHLKMLNTLIEVGASISPFVSGVILYLYLDWGSLLSIFNQKPGKDNGVIELYQNSVTGLSYNWPLYDRARQTKSTSRVKSGTGLYKYEYKHKYKYKYKYKHKRFIYIWPLYDRGQTLAGNLLPGSNLKQEAINKKTNTNTSISNTNSSKKSKIGIFLVLLRYCM